jgi:hypothetical protein
MENAELSETIEKIIKEAEKLIPAYMQNEEDRRIANGNVAICIIEPNGRIFGKMFGTNSERGVYRTRDGGKTWQQILFKNDSTGAIDIDFDPSNPNTIYATMWQVYRQPWKLNSGGNGSGLYKSYDGGDTWTLLSKNPGMPKGLLGKICVAVSATNPQRAPESPFRPCVPPPESSFGEPCPAPQLSRERQAGARRTPRPAPCCRPTRSIHLAQASPAAFAPSHSPLRFTRNSRLPMLELWCSWCCRSGARYSR